MDCTTYWQKYRRRTWRWRSRWAGSTGHLDPGRNRVLVLLLRDHLLLEHGAENHVPAAWPPGDGPSGCWPTGSAPSRPGCRLRNAELVGRDPEVPLGRGFRAVGLVVEEHDVQVTLEDLGLGQLVLQGGGLVDVLQLALDGVGHRGLGRRLVAVNGGLLQVRVLDVLLGDGRGALGRTAGLVVDQRPHDTPGIHGAVLVEPGVLDRHHGLLQPGRDLRQRHLGAVLGVEVRDRAAVGRRHHRGLRQVRIDHGGVTGQQAGAHPHPGADRGGHRNGQASGQDAQRHRGDHEPGHQLGYQPAAVGRVSTPAGGSRPWILHF